MNIFLGSSREALESGLLLTVATWVEAEGYKPVRWDEPQAFPAGSYTFAALRELARKVDGAIFVFSEDDDVWYRMDKVSQPRDNVLIEYGLFSGTLGEDRVIICRSGAPRTATDLLGITYVDMSELRLARAQMTVVDWLRRLKAPEAGAMLLERLNSPFQASGKQSLFLKGTDLLRRARRRVALVAKTPIVLVGCRPYDDSDTPYSYEAEQLEIYKSIVEKSSADGRLNFICIASRTALLAELHAFSHTALARRVHDNYLLLQAKAASSRSRMRLRWYEGSAPMTFLVSDDDFMIWFKDGRGESVWITAHDEVVSRALYSLAEEIGDELKTADVLREINSASP